MLQYVNAMYFAFEAPYNADASRHALRESCVEAEGEPSIAC